MGNLLINERDIVVPGELLAEGMDYLPSEGTFREGDKIIASQVGLINVTNRVVKIIPLSGKYGPKRGDTVIGTITDILYSGWLVDIGYAYLASLPLRDTSEFIDKGADLSQYYDFGDIICAKVAKVIRKSVDLTMKAPGLRKLKGGIVIGITSSKVPRIIGKQGSMISMIKEKTNCKITVGQNGKVWILGEDPKMEKLAIDTIRKIDKEAHENGLTDKIKNFLEKS